jgi:hypothetical protein
MDLIRFSIEITYLSISGTLGQPLRTIVITLLEKGHELQPPGSIYQQEAPPSRDARRLHGLLQRQVELLHLHEGAAVSTHSLSSSSLVLASTTCRRTA